MAYGGLAGRYRDRLVRVCYLLLHDRHAAEDAVQETFARALQQMDAYRGESPPAAWFYGIAVNVCRRELRDRERHARPAGHEALDAMRVASRGIITSVMRRETAARLAIELGCLPERQREAFVLHYVEHLPYEEIAPLLGTSVGAARVLSHRARALLQRKVS
jgi:RNA polymerase sigma-70 factor (ECF subfamily)